MKRVLGWALAGIVGLVLVVGVVFAVSLSGMGTLVDGAPAGSFGRVVKTGISSAVVMDIGEGQLGLIDCGSNPAGTELLAELKRRGVGPEAVHAIFLTHGHQDHTAGCALFKNATVYAMAADVPLVEGKVGSHGPVTRWMPVKPTGITVGHPMYDGEGIPLGSVAVRAFAVPGHTPGSAAYRVDDVLFLGDSASVGKDGKLHPAPWIFSDDLGQNHASLKALVTKLQPGPPVQRIVTSHTGTLPGGLEPLRALAATF